MGSGLACPSRLDRLRTKGGSTSFNRSMAVQNEIDDILLGPIGASGAVRIATQSLEDSRDGIFAPHRRLHRHYTRITYWLKRRNSNLSQNRAMRRCTGRTHTVPFVNRHNPSSTGGMIRSPPPGSLNQTLPTEREEGSERLPPQAAALSKIRMVRK